MWEESSRRGCLSCRRDYRRYICWFIFSVSWSCDLWWWRYNGCSEGWTSYDDGEDGWGDAGRGTRFSIEGKTFKTCWSDIEVWIYRCGRDRSYVFCIFYYNGRWISGIFFYGTSKGRAGFDRCSVTCGCDHCMCSTRRIAAYDISCINAKYK